MAAARPVWSGLIQFSLVSIPVKAFSAGNTEGGRPALNQLHRECGHRIQYKKTCPIHGEVQPDQIVSGYQFAEGQYVTIEASELARLRPEKEKAMAIESFMEPDKFDPRYFAGRTWYLLPDGKAAQKPYTLLRRAMADGGKVAFARMTTVGGKRQLLTLRTLRGLLVADTLNYAAEVRKPEDIADLVAPAVEVDPAAMKLARTVVDQLHHTEFDMAAYRDDYADRMRALVEQKVNGEEIVQGVEEEAPNVINLMEALQRSVAAATKAGGKGKPAKVASPGSAEKAERSKRRKRA